MSAGPSGACKLAQPDTSRFDAHLLRTDGFPPGAKLLAQFARELRFFGREIVRFALVRLEVEQLNLRAMREQRAFVPLDQLIAALPDDAPRPKVPEVVIVWVMPIHRVPIKRRGFADEDWKETPAVMESRHDGHSSNLHHGAEQIMGDHRL